MHIVSAYTHVPRPIEMIVLRKCHVCKCMLLSPINLIEINTSHSPSYSPHPSVAVVTTPSGKKGYPKIEDSKTIIPL